METIELTYCLCGDLMKKEKVTEEIPVCRKCKCDTQDEIRTLEKRKRDR